MEVLKPSGVVSGHHTSLANQPLPHGSGSGLARISLRVYRHSVDYNGGSASIPEEGNAI